MYVHICMHVEFKHHYKFYFSRLHWETIRVSDTYTHLYVIRILWNAYVSPGYLEAKSRRERDPFLL